MQYLVKQSPRVTDFNRFGDLTLEAILKLCEECSSRHAGAVQENVVGMSLNGKAWIATEWAIQIVDHHLHFGDDVITKTWTHGTQATLVCEREYSIENSEGKPLVYAAIKAAQVDLTDGKLIRTSKELCEAYGPEDISHIQIKKLPKLREPEDWDEELKVHLRKSDMDYNGHVHNTYYMPIAGEILPEDVSRKTTFVRIIYRKGITGTKVILKRKTIENQTIVGFYNEDGDFCSIISYK